MRSWSLLTAFALSVVSVLTVSPARAAVEFSEDFEALPTGVAWRDGGAYGGWQAVYNGYGTTTVHTDGSRVLSLAPRRVTSLDQTSAGLVVSRTSFADLDLRLRLRTVEQLRSPRPNPWEVAWIVWSFQRDEQFYYFIPKPNGWELGQSNDQRLDPAGPECSWPAYRNCRFAGAQRYLATGSRPRFGVGPWRSVRIRQIGSVITVWVNDTRVVSYTDREAPLRGGRLGLYAEDAHAHYDAITVTPPAS
jgi:Domain of Unknown Function (DUF1080)